ncbi:META domain-containing protein [Yoonia sp.]|uniref:META domain-containing protein n=1 Tax=Yoonia sp. TaxID=2212373 RepID=UPI001A0F4622|nr:META domain-containing protein [Yoonia sp.]MBE0414744.1 META domain-containing protein [Yoonia sp.]
MRKPFLGMIVSLFCLPTLLTGQPVAQRLGAHGLALPATFTGTLPCADCPGITYHLDLWDDGQGYALRRTYLERDLTLDEVGRWHVDPARGALILQGSGGAQSVWQIGTNQDIRMMDQDGNPILSDLPYTLVSGPLTPTDLALPVSGMMTYFADAALLTECQTGQRFPIVMEADYLALERAYLAAAPAPAAPLLVRLTADIAQRPQMEGPDRRSIVVTQFDHATPDADCLGARTPAPLANVYWGLTHLGGAPIAPTPGHREAYLLLSDSDMRFSGTVGCNMMMGALTQQDDAVTFGPVASTLMACPPELADLERDFAQMLETVRHVDLADQTLRLLDENRVERARLQARYTRF